MFFWLILFVSFSLFLKGSSKHLINHSAITCSIQTDDIVACILLLYNPITKCPLHIHAYRCDSESTAQALNQQLQVLINRPENQKRFAELESRLVFVLCIWLWSWRAETNNDRCSCHIHWKPLHSICILFVFFQFIAKTNNINNQGWACQTIHQLHEIPSHLCHHQHHHRQNQQKKKKWSDHIIDHPKIVKKDMHCHCRHHRQIQMANDLIHRWAVTPARAPVNPMKGAKSAHRSICRQHNRPFSIR